MVSNKEMLMIKAVIFDWGRTLYDSESEALFPETIQTLETLAKKYQLAIVSLATDGDFEKRSRVLRVSGIERYFTSIQFAQTDKDRLYSRALIALGVVPEEVAIVDDRIIRGIRWGNHNGATTVWLRRGKFMGEGPNGETGMPTHIIENIGQVSEVL